MESWIKPCEPLGTSPCRVQMQNTRELHLPEGVLQDKWVTRAVSKDDFSLRGFPDGCCGAGCNWVLSGLHGIEYEVPQAGHQEQVSIRGV